MPAQIGPGIQSAYEGFFHGLNMVQDATRKQADNKWAAQTRERDQAMWQERDSLERSKLQDHAQDLQNKAALRPQAQELQTKKLANANKDLDLAGKELDHKMEQQPQVLRDADIASHLQSAKNGQEALQSFMQLGGQALSHGDMGGVTKVMTHLVQAKLIDAGGMGVPVRTQLINVPKSEAATDFAGQPIAGQALKVLTDQGAEVYVNPSMMRDAYQAVLAQQDAAGAKVVKPGEKWVTPKGRVLAEGAPRVTGGIVVDPETGEVTDMRPRPGAAGGGSATGTGAKAGKTPVDVAMAAFETLSQKGETKLSSDQIAAGQMYVERAVSAGLTPSEAAYVASEVAVNGSDKVLQPFFDPNTLQITGAYSNPRINGGAPIAMEPGNMSLEAFASTPGGKATGQKVLTQATEMYLRTTPAQNDEQRQAVRSMIQKAATDPVQYERTMAALQGGDPAKVQHIQRLIDAHRVFGEPTKTQPQPQPQQLQPPAPQQAPAPVVPAAPSNLGGIGLGQAASSNPEVDKLTADAINTMGREDVRQVLNNAPLMRNLSNEQRQALQMRFSLARN